MKLIDRWTTQDGQWEANGKPYAINPWALERWANEDIPGKGGANHIFVKAPVGANVHFETSDGENPEDRTVDSSGWVNFPLFHSSAYVPSRGEQGPWVVSMNGDEIARGIGLPDGLHVSTFLVADATAIGEPPTVPPVTNDELYRAFLQIRALANAALKRMETQ